MTQTIPLTWPPNAGDTCAVPGGRAIISDIDVRFGDGKAESVATLRFHCDAAAYREAHRARFPRYHVGYDGLKGWWVMDSLNPASGPVAIFYDHAGFTKAEAEAEALAERLNSAALSMDGPPPDILEAALKVRTYMAKNRVTFLAGLAPARDE